MKKYNIVDRAKFTFYQIPKLLVHGKTYKNELTANDILAYAILMDRLNVSIKNNWLDESGHIYFVYSNDELVDLLQLSKPTVIKIKKNLQRLQLLEEERTGRANRLYLLEPVPADLEEAKYILTLDTKVIPDTSTYTETDKQQLQANLEKKKSLSFHEVKNLNYVAEKPLQKESVIKQPVTKLTSFTSEVKNLNPSKNNLITNKDYKENKEIKKSDHPDRALLAASFKPNQENKELESQLIADYIQEKDYAFIYGAPLMQVFKAYSFNHFETFVMFCNKLVFAQKSVEKETGIAIVIYEGTPYSDFTREQLLRTFKRCIQAERFKKADNIANYLFVSFKNVFLDYAAGRKESSEF